MQRHVAGRCRSSARAFQGFYVRLALKAGEINHEQREGHEEFVGSNLNIFRLGLVRIF
jgi:hypothetical protein